MTYADVISRVRLAVDDNVLSHTRVTDANMLTIIVDGIREIWKFAPASRYEGLSLRTDPLSEPVLTTNTVPLADRWIEPLFNYTVSRVFGLGTGERTNLEAAQNHYQRFRQGL